MRTAADRVAAVDVSFFAATHTFDCDGGARGTMRAIRGAGGAGGGALRSAEGAFAGSAASGAASAGRPLARFALSPDGRWMVAGAADGSARLFDVDVGGVGVALPAAGAPPGVRVNDVAWSPAAHCVAVCAAGGARPLRLAAHAEHARAVVPPPRPKRLLALSDSEANRGGVPRARVAAAMKQQRESAGFGEEATRARRPQLPAKLTPEAVREMLAKVRVESAAQRRGALDGVRRARAATPSRRAEASAAGAAYGGAGTYHQAPPALGAPGAPFAPGAPEKSPSGKRKTRREPPPRRRPRRRRRFRASTRTEGASGGGSPLTLEGARSRERPPSGPTDSFSVTIRSYKVGYLPTSTILVWVVSL